MERRQVEFKHLNEAVMDARNLANSGYEQTAGWTLEENLEHLIKTMTMSIEGIEWGLPRLVRPLIRWWMMPKVRTGNSHAIGMRASAPPGLRPTQDRNLERLLDDFEALANRMESPEVQFIDSHPVFGKISTDDWRWAHRWHSAHHLSHLVPRNQGPD